MNAMKTFKSLCGPFPRGLGPIASRLGRNGVRTGETAANQNGSGSFIAGVAIVALGNAWKQAVGDSLWSMWGEARGLSAATNSHFLAAKAALAGIQFKTFQGRLDLIRWRFQGMVLWNPFKFWSRPVSKGGLHKVKDKILQELKVVAGDKARVRMEYREVAAEAARVAGVKIWQMEDAEAIREYTGNGYIPVNKALRSADPACDPAQKTKMTEEIQMQVDGIVRALSKLPRYEKGRVFRGTDLSFGQELKVGDVFQDFGFLSTSRMRGKAFKRRFLFVITGTSGVEITKYSSLSQEKEILYPPRTRFLIKKVKEDVVRKRTEVTMEEISR